MIAEFLPWDETSIFVHISLTFCRLRVILGIDSQDWRST
jgi:hypothetical protein